jgi:anti-sigma regulatory factor (Ser/Thr protein kinase)
VWHNQAILNEAEFALDGNLRELEPLFSRLSCFCRENGLDDDVEFDLSLVLEELFTNSVRHGGCAGVPRAAEVRLWSGPDGVTLEYADRGAPFNPLEAAAPDFDADLDARAAGGLGIHLVRQVMRDLEYRRANGWNRLSMRRAPGTQDVNTRQPND